MLNYFARRLLYMFIVLFCVSILSFYIINLPPGSWIENYALELEASGDIVDQEELDFLKQRYGLDRPLHEQYLRLGYPAHHRRRLRSIFRMGAAGLALDRRAPLPHDDDIHRVDPLHLRRVRADRPVFRHQPVFHRRLFLLLYRLDRLGHAQLSHRPRLHDHHAASLRRHARRTSSPRSTCANRGAWRSSGIC